MFLKCNSDINVQANVFILSNSYLDSNCTAMKIDTYCKWIGTRHLTVIYAKAKYVRHGHVGEACSKTCTVQKGVPV